MLLFGIFFAVWIAYFTIPFFWLLVHPFAEFWRRRRGRTYAAFAVAVWLGMEAAFWLTANFWYRERFPRPWPVWLLAGAFILVEPLMVWLVEGELTVPILVGWAERDPHQFPPRLIDAGIYSRIRHPRYLGAMSALLGLALISGSLRLLEMSLLSLPLYWVLTEAEDRELLQRVGEPFRLYRDRVPRFIPRL